jgi:hypothetical protein
MPRTALAGSTYSPKRPLRCAAVARVAVDAADPRWHGAPVYPPKTPSQGCPSVTSADHQPVPFAQLSAEF